MDLRKRQIVELLEIKIELLICVEGITQLTKPFCPYIRRQVVRSQNRICRQ